MADENGHWIRILQVKINYLEWNKNFILIFTFSGKDSVITCILYLLYILIYVFFDLDSKSLICFRLSRVVLELWMVKITRKIIRFVKKYKK